MPRLGRSPVVGYGAPDKVGTDDQVSSRGPSTGVELETVADGDHLRRCRDLALGNREISTRSRTRRQPSAQPQFPLEWLAGQAGGTPGGPGGETEGVVAVAAVRAPTGGPVRYLHLVRGAVLDPLAADVGIDGKGRVPCDAQVAGEKPAPRAPRLRDVRDDGVGPAIAYVHRQRDADLPQVAPALDGVRSAPRLRQRRHEQRGQHRDDRDDDQQLDQGESGGPTLAGPSVMIVVMGVPPHRWNGDK